MIILFFFTLLIQPSGPVDWPFDELIHANGSTFRGMILDETTEAVSFQVVTRLPGRPTVTLSTSFSKSEVARLVRLTDSERVKLKTRLAELDPLGKGERDRISSLKLSPANWLEAKDAAWRYDSDSFSLISNAGEDITKRAAVRLEQLDSAMRRYLPRRNQTGRPTTIYLAPSPEEYRAILGPDAPMLLNPAVFDVPGNRIVCGSNLRKLGEQLTGTRIQHERQRGEIAQYEADIRKLYKDSKPDFDRYLAHANLQRKKIDVAEAANETAFNLTTRQLFAILYHESFHAYAAQFAFPDRTLPRWLNEGLAQIFETAIVEAGELRVGHADANRLIALREPLKTGLMPLNDLIKANGTGFLAAHTDAKAASDRAYLTAWALSHDLLFSSRSLNNGRFDQYLTDLKSGMNPITAFESWIGEPLETFETKWRDRMGRLQADGTLK